MLTIFLPEILILILIVVLGIYLLVYQYKSWLVNLFLFIGGVMELFIIILSIIGCISNIFIIIFLLYLIYRKDLLQK